MTQDATAPAAPAAPKKILFFPRFNAKGALVGWDEGPAREGALSFETLPDVPTRGTHRWNGGAFEPIPMWVPRFDAEGGYIGCEKVELTALPLGTLAFDHEPDNASDGRYRWDHNLQRFEPRPHIVAELGDTKANNQMVVAAIVGVVDRETLPMALQDQVRFLERSPETIAHIKKQWGALTGRMAAAKKQPRAGKR